MTGGDGSLPGADPPPTTGWHAPDLALQWRPVPAALLIDDDPDIRTVGRLALERVGGFEVALASSGAEALRALAGARFDVILLDAMMPGESGLALLARVRARVEVPVIFLTARVQQRDVEEYRAAGAAGVIAKPFDPMTLAGEVRRLAGLGGAGGPA